MLLPSVLGVERVTPPDWWTKLAASENSPPQWSVNTVQSTEYIHSSISPHKELRFAIRCHFWQQTTPKIAVFQQLSYATLPHLLTTHQLTHRSRSLRPRIRGRLHPLVPQGLIKRFIVAHCTLRGRCTARSISERHALVSELVL